MYGSLPIDSMHNLVIDNQGQSYEPMDVGGDATSLDFDNFESIPHSNQDLSDWCDTDL